MGMLIDNTHADSVHSFIRGAKAKARCCSTGGKIRGLPPSARPFSSTSTRPPPQPGRDLRPGAGGHPLQNRRGGAALANDSDYGLGAAVWTRDLSRAHRMSRRLKAGSVFVNNYNDGDMTVPFGGYKQSGNGRDKSLHALEKFTELKTIWIALES
jgi:gamma-glutamyl-gamma-aminobutyraldehyde dehydrogenase